MPGSNAGTGRPIMFICSVCRPQRWRRERAMYGTAHDVELTGRVRKAPIGGAGIRNSRFLFEYRCPHCKRRRPGWSRHIELERAYQREYGGSVNDLKKLYPDEFRFDQDRGSP